MADRRTLQPGDRCRISEAEIEGVVRQQLGYAVVVRADDGTEYRLPPVLVDGLPPVDEPELPVGAIVRDADGTGRCWWYLPDSTTDSPFISVVKVGDSKFYREYFRRDELPARITIVEASRA